MKIDIYQSAANHTKYLTVPAGADPGTLNLTDTDYASVRPFKQDMEIAPTDTRSALDSRAAIAALTSAGYYLHSAEINIS